MASAIIHYVISNMIFNEINVQDRKQFLLGASVGPDASSHEDGSYDIAHFWCKSCDQTRKGINWNSFAKKYKETILKDDFVLGYYCHLMQDAVWFHDIVDQYIRCYQCEEKKLAYQRSYRDYTRLNYLLIKEFHLEKMKSDKYPDWVKEITEERFFQNMSNFEKWFHEEACEKEDLDIYQWDVIQKNIEKCVSICVSEIKSLIENEEGIRPDVFFVSA